MIRQIFVVGCPRSGTTYVQSLLAAHPDVVSFPETHFFRAVGRRPRVRLGLASIRGREQKALQRFLEAIDRPDLARRIPAGSRRLQPYVDAFQSILDTLAGEQNAAAWVEKTPDHLHFISQIQRFLPAAQFVHVVRAGADVVASLFDVVQRYPAAWAGPYDLDWCITRWNEDVALTAAQVGRAGHHWLRYETVARRPDLIANLFPQLGLAPAAISDSARRAAAAALVGGDEPWKANVSAAGVSDDKFTRVLTAAQQAYVRQKLRPLPASLAGEPA